MKVSRVCVNGLPMAAIAMLELSILPQAVAETGLNGSYAGMPVDVGTILNNNPAVVTNPNGLADAIVNEALKNTKIIPEYQADGSLKTKAIGAQFQGRYDLPNSPLSVRGSVYLGDNAKAVLPTVTYDLPVGTNTNLYAGAGVAWVNTLNGKSTPLGTQTGVVLTTGVEAAISQGVILYGDAKWLSSHKTPGSSPLRYQVGVGYRF